MPRPPSTGTTAPVTYPAASLAEEDDDAGDLGRRGVTTERDGRHDLRATILGELRGHVGVDEAGGDDVRGDAAAAELARQRAGDADQPGLGRGVVGLAGGPGLPHHARDEDETTAAQPDHALGRAPRDAQGADEVRVDDRVDVLVGHPQDQGVAGDAGVGDGDLHRAELGLHAVEGGVDARAVGDVGGQDEDVGARQGLGELARAGGDRDAVARGDERLGDGQADPPVAPGHQHDAAHAGRLPAAACARRPPSRGAPRR